MRKRRFWRGVSLPSGAILAMAGGTGKSLMPLFYLKAGKEVTGSFCCDYSGCEMNGLSGTGCRTIFQIVSGRITKASSPPTQITMCLIMMLIGLNAITGVGKAERFLKTWGSSRGAGKLV
jgi:hypothetical protein